MWTIIRRVIPPIVLLAAGIGSLLYGVLYHRQSIVEVKTSTQKIPIPMPFGPGMFFEEPPAEGEPLPGDHPAPPDEESPFEQPAAEEESPFETPAAKEEESPFEETPDEERSLMERFSLDGDSDSEESLSGGLPFGGPGPFGPADPFGGPPQFIEETIEEEIFHEEPEWVLIREVSVSGLMRLANGQLKRTYSGKPPDFCKT